MEITTLPLSTHLTADCRALVLDQVVDIGLQLSAGLDFLHLRGCMHGDLKPNNIGVSVVGGRLVAKLLDAGSFRHFPPGDVGSLRWNVPGQMPYVHLALNFVLISKEVPAHSQPEPCCFCYFLHTMLPPADIFALICL